MWTKPKPIKTSSQYTFNKPEPLEHHAARRFDRHMDALDQLRLPPHVKNVYYKGKKWNVSRNDQTSPKITIKIPKAQKFFDEWLSEEVTVMKYEVQTLEEILLDRVGKIVIHKPHHNGKIVPQIAADDKWIIVSPNPKQSLKHGELRIEPVALSKRLLDEARSKGTTYQKSTFARNVYRKLMKTIDVEAIEAKKWEGQRVAIKGREGFPEYVAVDGKWIVLKARKRGNVQIHPVALTENIKGLGKSREHYVNDVHYTTLKKVRRRLIDRLADLEAAGSA